MYYLQNADAEELAKVLMAIPAKQGKETTAKGKTPVISKEVQVVADAPTNSLVITSNKDDYLVLESVIRKLDIPRRMVYIEALIMEVSVSKNFELGVQWQAGEDVGSHDGRSVGVFGASIPSNPISTGSIPDGFSLGVLGDTITIGGVEFASLSAVIRMMKTDTDVNILSTPQIMTTDNEEAQIQVVENRPFLTRQDTSSTSDINYSNYEFKDVGVILTITPRSTSSGSYGST